MMVMIKSSLSIIILASEDKSRDQLWPATTDGAMDFTQS